MEFFRRLFEYPLAEQISNFHGLVTFLSFLAFGAIAVLVVLIRRGVDGNHNLQRPLATILGIQSVLVFITSLTGIIAYVDYRTAGGARTFLLETEERSWLHEIVFEYKEYIGAITPWLLILIAFFLVAYLGRRVYESRAAQTYVMAANIISLVFIMLTAALAVLVVKEAPLQDFDVGPGLFSRGGNLVVLFGFLFLVLIAGLYWFMSRNEVEGADNAFAAMMYGGAFGLTVMWIVLIIKENNPGFNTAIAYIKSVGPYSGVILFSLIAIIVGTLVAWILTRRGRASLSTASWILFIACFVQLIMLFPPVWHLFVS